VLGEGNVKGVACQFGDAVRPVDVDLELGDLGEDRHLVGLLEPAEAGPGRTRLRRDSHHRRVRPVGGGNTGHEVGDAGAVLSYAHTMAAGDRE